MPYKIIKVKGGYKVQNQNTKKTFSKKPMTKEKARDQLAAIYVNQQESL